MGLYGGTSGLSAQNGTSRLHSYLGEKVNLCTIHIFSESSTFAGYDGTQRKCELGVFRGPFTEKRLPIRKSYFLYAN